MKTTPNGNRYWLKEHQITAFWHGFGISNGLDLKESEVKKSTEKGKTFYYIPPEVMQARLQEYINWLEQYASGWDRDGKHPYNINTRKAFLKGEETHASRKPIREMIELLQACRINDKK